MSDHALDALLAEYVAPPAPAGLAGRVAAVALALPQEPRLAYVRRAPRDRRGSWLRRPMIIGGVALGLAVSGAVAATLAGVRLDRLAIVEAVLAKLPFAGRATPAEAAPQASPPPHSAPPAPAPVPVEPPLAVEVRAEAEPPAPGRAPARDDALPDAAPAGVPERAEAPAPRRIETRPPPFALPPPAPLPAMREERAASIPAPEPRAPAAADGDEARPQQERIERIERAERLRAARQAQIERLQRIQQRRERIRRLRRD